MQSLWHSVQPTNYSTGSATLQSVSVCVYSLCAMCAMCVCVLVFNAVLHLHLYIYIVSDDNNRVVLKPMDGHPDCQRDFINASYIHVSSVQFIMF